MLTISAAAQIFGFPRNTVARAVLYRRIPSVRVPCSSGPRYAYLLSEEAVRRWAEGYRAQRKSNRHLLRYRPVTDATWERFSAALDDVLDGRSMPNHGVGYGVALALLRFIARGMGLEDRQENGRGYQ